jgi:hypothetical protein
MINFLSSSKQLVFLMKTQLCPVRQEVHFYKLFTLASKEFGDIIMSRVRDVRDE